MGGDVRRTKNGDTYMEMVFFCLGGVVVGAVVVAMMVVN